MSATSMTATASARDATLRATMNRWLAAHRHDLIVIVVIGLAHWSTDLTGALGAYPDQPAQAVALGFLRYSFILSTVLVLAARWVERQQLVGWRHVLTAAFAMLFAALAHGALYLLQPWGPTIGVTQGFAASPPALALLAFWEVIAVGPLLILYFTRQRKEDEAARRLLAVQIDQRVAARRVAGARLQSLQARIDPQLLFHLLDTVQQAYRVDPPRAERMLDELIVFLRTALSRLRTSSSTIGQETELIASYVRLLNLAGTVRTTLATSVADAVRAAPFHPACC